VLPARHSRQSERGRDEISRKPYLARRRSKQQEEFILETTKAETVKGSEHVSCLEENKGQDIKCVKLKRPT